MTASITERQHMKKTLSVLLLSSVLVSGFGTDVFAATPKVTGDFKTAYNKYSKQLGKPTSNKKCGLTGGGCSQSFQKGTLYWSKKTKVQPVFNGSINTKWKKAGGLSKMGYPVNALKKGLKNSGQVQSFTKGSIHYSPKTGAKITKGAIRSKWKSLKWEKGKLGYPTSDEFKSGSNRKQNFQGGSITWNKKSGAKVAYKSSKPSIPSSFNIEGSGFGHGVGMSQYGAQGMAKEKWSTKKILEHYYNPAKLTNTTKYANSNIKVQILGGVTSSTITPKSGSLRVKAGGKTLTTSKALTIKQSGSTRTYSSNGKKLVSKSSYDTIEWQNTRYWKGTKTTLVNVAKANGGSGSVDYRHGRLIIKTLNKKLNLVNQLRVNDEYLYGLAEMPSSWETNALSAQVVAGRTYAYRNMSSVKKDCDCNVYDEVKSQKFIGWNKENEGTNAQWGKRWKNAVDKTVSRNKDKTIKTSQVMMYKGAYIDAVYSSSSNGKTQSSKDMWGGNLPYLQSRSDKWSTQSHNPNRSWTVKATQAKMKQVFGLNNVSSVTVKKNSSGYATSLTAKSSTGKTKTITGAQARAAFGLKSTGISRVQNSK